MCTKFVTTVEKLNDCITTKVQKAIRHATLSQVSLDIYKNNICTIVILKFKHTMMQYLRNNGYTQNDTYTRQISPHLLYAGLYYPVAWLQWVICWMALKLIHKRLNIAAFFLHYFSQQQEHQVAYSVKQKKTQSTNEHLCHNM